MTGIERIGTDWTYAEDWLLTCGMKHDGVPCTSPASYWVSFHHVGRCSHPALEYGNRNAWVCIDHVLELEAKAARVVRYYNPPWYLAWWTNRRPFCPTCGIPVQNDSDVLQERQKI